MKIMIASPIDQDAIRRLQEKHEVVCVTDGNSEKLRLLIQNCDAMVFRSGIEVTADLLAHAPKLALLIRAGCGVDNVDLEEVGKRRISLLRITEPGAQAVAEMAFALMLALARNLREADTQLRRGRWAKHELDAFLLSGKVLGIVGAGNIGSRVGQIGAALGMTPIGCVREASPATQMELAQRGIKLASFDEVVSTADFLTIHVPLDDSTRNLINAEVLSRVKPGAFLVNLARGGVVDEAALHSELVPGGRMRGAALDVHEQEGEGKISRLAGLPNVILTPHMGATTIDTQREIGRRVIELIESFRVSKSRRGRKARTVQPASPCALVPPAIPPLEKYVEGVTTP